MNKEKCPKVAKCPIFIEGVLYSKLTGTTYKNQYCLKPDKYELCKRYIASGSTQKPIPPHIMPNTTLSIEDILKEAARYKN